MSISFRAVFGMMVFAAVLSTGTTFAHDQEQASPVGSWSGVAVSTTVPLPPLRVLLTINEGGAMTESRRLFLPFSPLGPLIATPGHGQWRKTGAGEYVATVLLLYEGTADHPTAPGQVVGEEKVQFKLNLVDGGQRLQGTIQVQVKDAAGNVVFIGPGTFDAERIRVELLP